MPAPVFPQPGVHTFTNSCNTYNNTLLNGKSKKRVNVALTKSDEQGSHCSSFSLLFKSYWTTCDISRTELIYNSGKTIFNKKFQQI